MISHWKNLRRVGLCAAVFAVMLLLTFGMVLDRHPVRALAIGVVLFAGLTSLCATFVFGPLAYSSRSERATLVRILFLFLCIGLLVVGTAAFRAMLSWAAAAA